MKTLEKAPQVKIPVSWSVEIFMFFAVAIVLVITASLRRNSASNSKGEGAKSCFTRENEQD